ncbi:hypothetical protein PIB30_085605, partial [Stylosanthes scabra]|nr:hypothetical protein [Stylosanthes scabra]
MKSRSKTMNDARASELQNQQTLTNKAVQELKESQDKHHKEFLAHKKELQKQYQKDREEYVTITNHEIDQDIPAFCLSNMEKGKGKFEGALRPIPVGGSSSKGKGVEDVDHGKKKTWEPEMMEILMKNKK